MQISRNEIITSSGPWTKSSSTVLSGSSQSMPSHSRNSAHEATGVERNRHHSAGRHSDVHAQSSSPSPSDEP